MNESNRHSAEWYRDLILSLPDIEPLVGRDQRPDESIGTPGSAVKIAFGALVRLERRSKRLSISDLAKVLDIEEDEIRSIEHDPAYKAKPRTIVGFARHFDLPTKELMKLAGIAASNDEAFVRKAMKFAAHSDDLGELTEDERSLLHSFVAFLRDGK